MCSLVIGYRDLFVELSEKYSIHILDEFKHKNCDFACHLKLDITNLAYRRNI